MVISDNIIDSPSSSCEERLASESSSSEKESTVKLLRMPALGATEKKIPAIARKKQL